VFYLEAVYAIFIKNLFVSDLKTKCWKSADNI